jgi:hypothetical protein
MKTHSEIIEFAAKVEAESNVDLNNTYLGTNGHDPSKKFTVTFGRKYAKIISNDANGSGGSVWGFVDIESGNLLKAAGWARPAPHARGNIETASYGRNYTWTGPNYLR